MCDMQFSGPICIKEGFCKQKSGEANAEIELVQWSDEINSSG